MAFVYDNIQSHKEEPHGGCNNCFSMKMVSLWHNFISNCLSIPVSPQVTNLLKLSLAEATIGSSSCSPTKFLDIASYTLYAPFLIEYRVEIIFGRYSIVVHALGVCSVGWGSPSATSYLQYPGSWFAVAVRLCAGAAVTKVANYNTECAKRLYARLWLT